MEAALLEVLAVWLSSPQDLTVEVKEMQDPGAYELLALVGREAAESLKTSL